MSLPPISDQQGMPSLPASAVSDISDDGFPHGSPNSPQFGPYCGPYAAWSQACEYLWRKDIRLLDLLVCVSVHEHPLGCDSLLEQGCSSSIPARTFIELLQFAAPDRLNDVDARSRGLIHRLIFDRGHEQGAKLEALLRKGADPNLPLGGADLNTLGEPPLMFCLAVKLYDMAMILLEGGADPVRTGREEGMNAIHAACLGDKDLILDKIAYKWPDANWDRALEMAVFSESENAIYFLACQVDVDHPTAGALFSPIHLAAEEGKVISIRALHRAGANLMVRGEEGMTALHLAASFDRPDAVRELLGFEKGLAEIKDEKGRTPVDLALTPETIEAFMDG